MNVDRWILVGLVVLTCCRWFLSASLELTGEEALSWMASWRVEPYFLEEGPLVAGLMAAGRWLGGGSEWALRFFNPLLVLGATGLLYLLTRSVYHQVVARWSVVLFQLCPVVHVAGVMMPDVALGLALMMAMLWFLWCGLHRAHRWHGFWWAGGVTLGLTLTLSPGLLALWVGVAGALAMATRWRTQWGRPGIWIFLGLGLAVPAGLYATSGHGWVALRYPFTGAGFHLRGALGALGWWVWWTGPLWVAGLVWVWVRPGRLRVHRGAWFLLLLGTLGGGGSLLWGVTVGHWPQVLWIVTVPMLAVLWGQWMQADVDLVWKARWRRWALLSTGAIAALGADTGNVRGLGIPWPGWAETPRLRQGWVESGEAVAAVLEAARASQPAGVFLIADGAQEAALLDFYLPAEAPVWAPDEGTYPRVHVVESAGWESPYALWPHYSHALPGAEKGSPYLGRTALYVTSEKGGELPANLVHAFASMEPAAVLEVVRRGRVLHRWHLYHLYEYEGLPL